MVTYQLGRWPGFAMVVVTLAACRGQAGSPTISPYPTQPVAGHATSPPAEHTQQAEHSAIPHPTSPVVTPAATVTPDAQIVPRYGIFEHDFRWMSSSYAIPWEQVQVTMTLTSPSGRVVSIGGFYYAPDTWRARYSPVDTGSWSWTARLTDGTQDQRSEGRFTVTDSAWPGFVRPNPDNPFRWVFDDGSAYYPIGIGDCITDSDRSGSPLDAWGFDGDVRGPGDPEHGWTTDIDTYLSAYSAAGVNLFRWSVDNCAFNLYQTIGPGGNVYGLREGLWGDELVQELRQYGFRIYMVLFGFNPPFPTGANPAQMDAIKRYVQYVVNRYGAYVDFWELMNEYPNPPATIDDAWYTQVAAYLRRVDPYQHPISTNWPRPDLAVVDINSPHWYQNEIEFDSDRVTWEQVKHWKAFGKPVIVGEQGNALQSWDERSAVRMRLRSWTAFFAEGALIFWNGSFAKDYRGGGASSLYLGPEERGYLRVLTEFMRGIDPRATVAEVRVSDPSRVRGYALRAPTAYVAYLHAYTDHVNPTSGIQVTVDVPIAGTATWMVPATGQVLATQDVVAGVQSLDAPPFVIDLALRITPP